MRLNTRALTPKVYTHEGAVAARLTPEQQLKRLTMACLLWEDNFYIDGKTHVQLIEEYAAKVKPDFLAQIAISLKERGLLRHTPLLILCLLLEKHKDFRAKDVIARVCTRADDITELLALYWRNGKVPLRHQLKQGISLAMKKFDTYQISKYSQEDKKISLRDAMFLAHCKPRRDMEGTYKDLANKTLSPPDTWEVRKSRGDSTEQTFSELIETRKLGILACLRNLRSMLQSGMDKHVIGKYLVEHSGKKLILPFQFLAAFEAAPEMIDYLETAMLNSLKFENRIDGKTIVLVDVSGSMEHKLSGKGTMTCMDAACGLAIIAREMLENVMVFTFSNQLVQIKPFRGMALRECIINSQQHGCTNLADPMRYINERIAHDRLICITDEQVQSYVQPIAKKSYMINIGSYRNGVGYRDWHHIDGFSQHVFDYIAEWEKDEHNL